MLKQTDSVLFDRTMVSVGDSYPKMIPRNFICCTVCLLLVLASCSSNVDTTTFWKLNPSTDRIVEADRILHHLVTPLRVPNIGNRTIARYQDDERIFNIITSTVRLGQSWIKNPTVIPPPQPPHHIENLQKNESGIGKDSRSRSTSADRVDCGDPVDFTYYDQLAGVWNRHRHPILIESPFSVLFAQQQQQHQQQCQKDGTVGTMTAATTVDLRAMEVRLRHAKRMKSKSIYLYNDIANYWRLTGNAELAIECFRRALSLSPNNAQILLNLGRLLFNLHYLDDAIYLIRRSLEAQQTGSNKEMAWLQYYTLGEILRAYGHFEEAAVHFRYALELNGNFDAARQALLEMSEQSNSSISMHLYTLVIIICLVFSVLLVVLSSADMPAIGEYLSQWKPHRAIKSLRGGFGVNSKVTSRR